jgi:hypothetical protein
MWITIQSLFRICQIFVLYLLLNNKYGKQNMETCKGI